MWVKYTDLITKQFGRWTVVSHSHGSYWTCRCECGNTASVQASNLVKGSSKSCGCLRREFLAQPRPKVSGEKHPRWRGGYITSEGYRKLRKDGKEVFEHRYVMQTSLGRTLLDHENVHHINGNRADNRPENLELWSTSQPSGQKVADKVAWAKEILSLYDSDNKVGS